MSFFETSLILHLDIIDTAAHLFSDKLKQSIDDYGIIFLLSGVFITKILAQRWHYTLLENLHFVEAAANKTIP